MCFMTNLAYCRFTRTSTSPSPLSRLVIALPIMAPDDRFRSVAFIAVTRPIGSSKQIARLDRSVVGRRFHVHAASNGDLCIAIQYAFLLKRQARLDVASTADNARHFGVVGRSADGEMSGIVGINHHECTRLDFVSTDIKPFGQIRATANFQTCRGRLAVEIACIPAGKVIAGDADTSRCGRHPAKAVATVGLRKADGAVRSAEHGGGFGKTVTIEIVGAISIYGTGDGNSIVGSIAIDTGAARRGRHAADAIACALRKSNHTIDSTKHGGWCAEAVGIDIRSIIARGKTCHSRCPWRFGPTHHSRQPVRDRPRRKHCAHA